MLLLLTACVDYVVKGEPVPADIEVSTRAVDAGSVCGTVQETLTIANLGDLDLTVTAEVAGEGWSVDTEMPVIVEGRGSIPVVLTGSPGRATLTVHSDDADEPAIDVALSAVADGTPSVVILVPAEEQFLDPDAAVTLEALASDDEDGPEALVATWISDASGEVAVTTPDDDGRIVTAWDPSARTSGPQVLQLQVADSCGRVGEASVFFCQDGAWEVDAVLADAWMRDGDAVVDQGEGTVTLGPGAGAAFDAFGIYDPERVRIDAEVRATGAGFSVTALDSLRMDGALGGDGCGLGFGDCDGGAALPGWSVAFDLQADANDCGAVPSVGYTVDGAMGDWEACASAGFDDGWHTVTVETGDGRLSVLVDGVAVLDHALSTIPSFPAFLGFTAADGDVEVRDVRFTDFTCACAAACD